MDRIGVQQHPNSLSNSLKLPEHSLKLSEQLDLQNGGYRGVSGVLVPSENLDSSLLNQEQMSNS